MKDEIFYDTNIIYYAYDLSEPEKRKGFFEMLDEIMDHKVEKFVTTYSDRLSRVGFELFVYLFRKFRTEIVTISEVGSTKPDSEEVFGDIASMLHFYSMKMYSKRKNHSIGVGYEGSAY